MHPLVMQHLRPEVTRRGLSRIQRLHGGGVSGGQPERSSEPEKGVEHRQLQDEWEAAGHGVGAVLLVQRHQEPELDPADFPYGPDDAGLLTRLVDSATYWPSYLKDWSLGRRTARLHLQTPEGEAEQVVSALQARGWNVPDKSPRDGAAGSSLRVILATKHVRGYGGSRSLIHEVASDVRVLLDDTGTARTTVRAVQLARPRYSLLREWRPNFDCTPTGTEPGTQQQLEVLRAKVYRDHRNTVLWGSKASAGEHWKALVGAESALAVPLLYKPPRSATFQSWRRFWTQFPRNPLSSWRRFWTHVAANPFSWFLLVIYAVGYRVSGGKPWSWRHREGVLLFQISLGLVLTLTSIAQFYKRRALLDAKSTKPGLPLLVKYGSGTLTRATQRRLAVLDRLQRVCMAFWLGTGLALYTRDLQAPTGPALFGVAVIGLVVLSSLILAAGNVLVRRAPRWRVPTAAASIILSAGVLSQIPQLFYYSYLSGVDLPVSAVSITTWEAFAAAARPFLGILMAAAVVGLLYIFFLSRLGLLAKWSLVLVSVAMFVPLWLAPFSSAFVRGERLAIGAKEWVNWGTTPRKICLFSSSGSPAATGTLPKRMWLLGVKDGTLVLLDRRKAESLAPPEDRLALTDSSKAPKVRPHPPVVRVPADSSTFQYFERDQDCPDPDPS